MSNLCVQPEEFINVLSNQKQTVLTFFHMNVRSVLSKIDDIEVLLDTLRFSLSVLMFSETWYTPDSNDFVLPNYKHFSIRRNARRGGGVSMLVESSLNCCIISDFTELNDSLTIVSTFVITTFSVCSIELPLETLTFCFLCLINYSVMLMTIILPSSWEVILIVIFQRHHLCIMNYFL